MGEELRDKIRENHQLQIKTRSLHQTIKKLTEKTEKYDEKITTLNKSDIAKSSKLLELNNDNISYKENNKLLNEKLNILLKENADNTLKNEKQIESIENYHLSKYKTLLKSFQMMKKRIELNSNKNIKEHKRIHSVGYSNQGWKKYHDDHNAMYFNFSHSDSAKPKSNKHLTYSIDLECDQEDKIMDNINDLNENINELTTSSSFDPENKISSKQQIRKYQLQMKEYKNIIHSLQKQVAEYSENLQDESKKNKKMQAQNKRLSKPKNVNIDYLRNVLVKFLILSEYLSDEQVVLVPVIGSILNLTQNEKDMIDNSYYNNRYFMGTNTLFPENANAKYSPSKKKKRKKHKREKRKANKVTTGDILATV